MLQGGKLDGGLDQGVHSSFHTLETLDDFIFMARQDKWEDSIEEMVKAVPSVKDNRVALARFKAAWECGNQAIKLAASTCGQDHGCFHG